MNIHIAARTLSGNVAGGNSILCPGPGHSIRDRSLSVTFTADGFTVFSHAGDDWRECKDHVRERLGLDFTPTADHQPIPIKLASAPVDRERVERVGSIWREARPIARTPADAYLASRGLSYRGEALRWHPSCPFGKGERHGCMIGLVRNIVTNEPQAIHRTAIDAHGRKIDRKAYGPMAAARSSSPTIRTWRRSLRSAKGSRRPCRSASWPTSSVCRSGL
jgi:putative DNA primase/helicase